MYQFDAITSKIDILEQKLSAQKIKIAEQKTKITEELYMQYHLMFVNIDLRKGVESFHPLRFSSLAVLEQYQIHEIVDEALRRVNLAIDIENIDRLNTVVSFEDGLYLYEISNIWVETNA